jgi:CheY-like chemotaxis protein
MRGKGFTILIADDEPNDRQMLELALETAGISEPVQFVPNGIEAIRYLAGEREYADRSQFAFPGFLITDLKMPQGSGFVLLEFLRRNPQLCIVPTLIFSASTDPDDVCKAYLLGAHAYLKKPTAFTDLVRLMKLFYEFWSECELPEVDSQGHVLPIQSLGKLGEAYSK